MQAPPFGVAPLPPEIRAQAIRRVARALAVTTFLTALLAAAFAATGRPESALGTVAGLALGLFCGLSWLGGVIFAFDAPFARLSRATIGLAPLRFGLVIVATIGAAWLGEKTIDPVALVLTLVAIRCVLHVLEALTLGTFSDATRAARPRPPAPAALV